MPIRLPLADGHPRVLVRLAALCSRDPDFEIVATVATGEGALQAVRQLRPDILLLDIHLADMDALRVLANTERA